MDCQRYKVRRTLILAGIALLLSACAGDSNLPAANGKAQFRVVNAMPMSPSIAFLIEERAVGSAEYKASSAPAAYDNLSYTFNFEAFLAGDVSRTRLASVNVDSVRDTLYTFLISGPLATPTITQWETELREWASTETVFEARFAHTSVSLGTLDVYFQAPGVAPVMGNQAASLSFGELSPTIELPGGDYVMILTTLNDPADILFTSTTLTPTAAGSYTYSVFDGDANDLDSIAVRQFADAGGFVKVLDESSLPTVRFFNGSQYLASVDVYTDELLADQLLDDHLYRDITADLPLATATYPLTYTTAGNVGSILFESNIGVLPGNRYDYYVVGAMDTLRGVLQLPDRRPVETLVKFNFMHTAANHASVDIYVVTAGTAIADAGPSLVNLTVGSVQGNLSLQAGDFEMYVTVNTEETVLAGPIAFSPALGTVVNYISYDNVDPAIVDVVAVPLP